MGWGVAEEGGKTVFWVKLVGKLIVSRSTHLFWNYTDQTEGHGGSRCHSTRQGVNSNYWLFLHFCLLLKLIFLLETYYISNCLTIALSWLYFFRLSATCSPYFSLLLSLQLFLLVLTPNLSLSLLVLTCPNLSLSLLILTCPYLSGLILTCLYLSLLVLTCPYLSLLVITCPYLSLLVLTYPYLSLLVQCCGSGSGRIRAFWVTRIRIREKNLRMRIRILHPQ